jgi:hypothetical protein
MFICGNDEEGKKTVIDNILAKFGWETIDTGGIDGSRLLEPLALLWITHYFRTGNGNYAFELLLARKQQGVFTERMKSITQERLRQKELGNDIGSQG